MVIAQILIGGHQMMDTGGHKKVEPPQEDTMSIHPSGLVVTESDMDSELNDPDNCADLYLKCL